MQNPVMLTRQCEIHGRGNAAAPQTFPFKSILRNVDGEKKEKIELKLCGCYGDHWIECHVIRSGGPVECVRDLVNHEQLRCP